MEAMTKIKNSDLRTDLHGYIYSHLASGLPLEASALFSIEDVKFLKSLPQFTVSDTTYFVVNGIHREDFEYILPLATQVYDKKCISLGVDFERCDEVLDPMGDTWYYSHIELPNKDLGVVSTELCTVKTKLNPVTVAKQELNKAMTVYKQHPSASHWVLLEQSMLHYQEVYFNQSKFQDAKE